MTKKQSLLLATLIFCLILSFPINNFPQNSSSQTLAAKASFTLTEEHVEFYVNLLQFVVGQKIKNSEVSAIRAQAINEFNNNPETFFAELNQFYSFMSELYKQTDPLQIANGRMFLIGQFYKVTQATPSNKLPSLIKISNHYLKVLHYNPKTQIALTNKDIEAVLEYIDFSRQLNGYAGLSYEEKQNFNKYMPNYYSQLPQQQQAVFVIMPIVWRQMEWQWQRLSPQQKQQVVAQHRAKNNRRSAPQYPNNSGRTYQNQQAQQNQKSRSGSSSSNQASLQQKQQMFNMMQDMNNSSYVTSMNIIENMGGSGNYWSMQDQNY